MAVCSLSLNENSVMAVGNGQYLARLRQALWRRGEPLSLSTLDLLPGNVEPVASDTSHLDSRTSGVVFAILFFADFDNGLLY